MSSHFNCLANSIESNMSSLVSSGYPTMLLDTVEIPASYIKSNAFIARSFLYALPTTSARNL